MEISSEQQVSAAPKIKWNEVTWYSRLGAIILFIGIVPALCFYIGAEYGEINQIVSAPQIGQVPPQPVSQLVVSGQASACDSAMNTVDQNQCGEKENK